MYLLSFPMPRSGSPQERKQYGLRLATSLMREVKHLAVDHAKPMNDLVEEALRDLMKKYREKRKGSGKHAMTAQKPGIAAEE